MPHPTPGCDSGKCLQDKERKGFVFAASRFQPLCCSTHPLQCFVLVLCSQHVCRLHLKPILCSCRYPSWCLHVSCRSMFLLALLFKMCQNLVSPKCGPPWLSMLIRFSLFWYCCLHCSFCSGIVQAINGGLPFAAACSVAHSVQLLSLLAVTLEKTHPPSPGWAQVLAWVFAALVQVL